MLGISDPFLLRQDTVEDEEPVPPELCVVVEWTGGTNPSESPDDSSDWNRTNEALQRLQWNKPLLHEVWAHLGAPGRTLGKRGQTGPATHIDHGPVTKVHCGRVFDAQ